MANLHRLLLAAALTLVASLAVASSASAAPGNGADVVRRTECFTYNYDDGTLCFYAKYVENSTETPSGNFSYHANGEFETRLTGEGDLQGCNASNSSKLNYQYLLKDGLLHESGSHQTGEFFLDCGYFQADCTFSYDQHYANGRLQFYRPEVNCNP